MKSSRFLALLVSILMIFAMATASLAAGKGKTCPKCGKEIQTENAVFYVVYKDGKKESFGCPHCGLSEIVKGDVKEAEATDFLRGKKLMPRQLSISREASSEPAVLLIGSLFPLRMRPRSSPRVLEVLL